MQQLKFFKTNSEIKISLKLFLKYFARLSDMAKQRSRALAFVAKQRIDFLKFLNINFKGEL